MAAKPDPLRRFDPWAVDFFPGQSDSIAILMPIDRDTAAQPRKRSVFHRVCNTLMNQKNEMTGDIRMKRDFGAESL